jgi:hypothetical protein
MTAEGSEPKQHVPGIDTFGIELDHELTQVLMGKPFGDWDRERCWLMDVVVLRLQQVKEVLLEMRRKLRLGMSSSVGEDGDMEVDEAVEGSGTSQ